MAPATAATVNLVASVQAEEITPFQETVRLAGFISVAFSQPATVRSSTAATSRPTINATSLLAGDASRFDDSVEPIEERYGLAGLYQLLDTVICGETL